MNHYDRLFIWKHNAPCARPYTKDAFKQMNYKMFGQVGPDR